MDYLLKKVAIHRLREDGSTLFSPLRRLKHEDSIGMEHSGPHHHDDVRPTTKVQAPEYTPGHPTARRPVHGGSVPTTRGRQAGATLQPALDDAILAIQESPVKQELRKVVRKHLWQDVLRKHPGPRTVPLHSAHAVVSTRIIELEPTHVVPLDDPTNVVHRGPLPREVWQGDQGHDEHPS
jgi:hypothetical protein